MSGPKVVRIVTREEILEICRGHLARVDAALEEWIRIGRRNDCIDEEAVAVARRRRDALAALIAGDRFMDLQKQAPLEEAFLRDDLHSRLAEVAAEQMAARSRERRGREAGASLLRTLERAGPVAPRLAEGLKNGNEAALAEGFTLLSAGTQEAGASTEMASRLREEGGSRSFASWLASRPEDEADPAVARVEARLVELAQVVDASRLADLRSRIDEARWASHARRSLLLDGLEVETGRALEAARRRSALLLDLRMVVAELESAGLASVGYLEDASSVEAHQIESRIARARAAIDEHRARLAASARRAAVLEGLAQLGYEVTEGMSTSLADEGRVVLRSASRPDYGVEVASAGARMQMKPVAFEGGGTGPDPARDRDAETIWCGDVSTLQAHLAKIGTGLEIERSLPVGAVPLKRVVVAGTEVSRVATVTRPRAREL